MVNNALVEKRVGDFLKFYTNWDNIAISPEINHISLMSGFSGIILLLIDLKDHFKDIVDDKIIVNYIKKTFELIENQERVYPTYCAGLAGYGFMLLKIKERNILNPHKHKDTLEQIDGLLEQIDEIVEEQIDYDIFDENYDLLHGLVGLGLYFLERGKSAEVAIVIDKLKETLIRENNTVYWKKFEKYQVHTTVIDLGCAHGIISNLYFLTKVASKNNDASLHNLIKEIIDFYLNNAQTIDETIYSHFPHLFIYEEYITKTIVPKNSRLAWCYGDVGILYGLYMAAKEIKDVDKSSTIVNMLLNVVKRHKESPEYALDAGFCHGGSGLAVIYKNLYEMSKEESFLKASNFWADKVFKINLDVADWDFTKLKATDYFENDNYTLLEGLAGVLYCYGKNLDIEMPLTDEIVLLKY
jgi:lantibiotic modifying enzyme